MLQVEGFMPCFSKMGYIANRLVKRAEDLRDLDAIIVPSGDFRKLSRDVLRRIEVFAERSGLVVGICDGVKVLARKVCRSDGICVDMAGLLEVEVDEGHRCEDAIVKVSQHEWVTESVSVTMIRVLYVASFSGITVGKGVRVVVEEIEPRKGFPAIIVGSLRNVVGVLPHDILDRCSSIALNIVRAAGGDEDKHLKEGMKLWKRVCEGGELGVDIGVRVGKRSVACKRALVITSTMEGEGKTVIATGLATLLRIKGFRVTVAKLGYRATDLYPLTYALREPLDRSNFVEVTWRSRRLGVSNWCESMRELASKHDFVLIEGFKGLFTGSSAKGSISSTIEFLKRSKIPVILVVSAISGVEDAAIRASVYVDKLIDIGIEVVSVIVNRFDGSEEEARYVTKSLEPIPVFLVPEDRALANLMPSKDIHDFTLRAIQLVKTYIDIDRILFRTPCIAEQQM